MRRFQIIIAILIVILSLGFSYHYIQQQQLKDTSQMFDQVMSEKWRCFMIRHKTGLSLYNWIFMIADWREIIKRFPSFTELLGTKHQCT